MFNSKTGFEKFQKESAKAFDIFNDTCKKLEEANKLGEVEIADRDAVIAKAQAEKDVILAVQAKNSKVITKIQKFFSDED